MSLCKIMLAVALAGGLAACGGGKGASQAAATAGDAGQRGMSNAGSNVKQAVSPPLGGVDRAGNAMAPGTLATIPPTVQCGAVQPVWVNTKTHVYHLPSDSRYGRTRHGVYMCPSAAKAEGDRAAGGSSMKRHHKSSSMQDENSSGD